MTLRQTSSLASVSSRWIVSVALSSTAYMYDVPSLAARQVLLGWSLYLPHWLDTLCSALSSSSSKTYTYSAMPR